MNLRLSILLAVCVLCMSSAVYGQYTIPLVISSCSASPPDSVGIHATWQNSNASCVQNNTDYLGSPYKCSGSCASYSYTTGGGGCGGIEISTTVTTCASQNITVTTNNASCQVVDPTAELYTNTVTIEVVIDCEPC
jgi:hypothetical protein